MPIKQVRLRFQESARNTTSRRTTICSSQKDHIAVIIIQLRPDVDCHRVEIAGGCFEYKPMDAGERYQLTDAHHNKKSCEELPKIQNRTSSPLTAKVIWIRTSPANPVGQRGKHVGCYDEEWVICFPERTAENNKEESNSQYLFYGA